uniref:Uncharacterized protein n=1 Tax=Magallana gigas TaxID=29159 RepID=K1PT71_MAGGI
MPPLPCEKQETWSPSNNKISEHLGSKGAGSTAASRDFDTATQRAVVWMQICINVHTNSAMEARFSDTILTRRRFG